MPVSLRDHCNKVRSHPPTGARTARAADADRVGFVWVCAAPQVYPGRVLPWSDHRPLGVV